MPTMSINGDGGLRSQVNHANQQRVVVPLGNTITIRYLPGALTLTSAYTYQLLAPVGVRWGGFPVRVFNLPLRGMSWFSALVTARHGTYRRPLTAGRYSDKPGDPRHCDPRHCFHRLPEFAGL